MTKKNKALLLTNRFASATTMATILALLLIALLLGVALFSYSPLDPAWSQNNGGTVTNNLGVIGAWYSDLSFSIIGKLSYLIPITLVAFAIQLWAEKAFDKELFSWRLFMLLTAILSGCVLWGAHDGQAINTVAPGGGGYLGEWLFKGLQTSVKSDPVIMAFSLIIFATSISLLFSVPWLRIIEFIGDSISRILGLASVGLVKARAKRKEAKGIKSVVSESVMPSGEKGIDDKPKFTIDRYEDEIVSPVDSSPAEDTAISDIPAFSNEKENIRETTARNTVVDRREISEKQTQPKSEPNFFNFEPIEKNTTKTANSEMAGMSPEMGNNVLQEAAEPLVTKTEPLVPPPVSETPVKPDYLATSQTTDDAPGQKAGGNHFEFSLLPKTEKEPAAESILDMTATEPTEQVASTATPTATQTAKKVDNTASVTIGKAYDSRSEPQPVVEKNYELPNISLLDEPPAQINAYTEDTLAEMAGILENTLKQFNVDATVMHVSPGPVITRFEIDLAPGIQAKKITALSIDLARALAVSNVRVEEVIPGSSYVGLEVPNKQRQIVYFKDIVRSSVFQKSRSPLTLSLGSDTSGKPVVADLMKMPHALVAGTTGSGKSVCINVMLLSMLFKATPKDLRLILVDPKMLEMSMYEDIPHLLTPVITDMNEAENALTWAVGEMERRYQLMAALKVRKIDAFNQYVDEANAKGEPIKDPLWEPNESVGYTHHPNLERLPFIVIVIDELADMMMVVGKQVEQLIARLTQKARAAGIHVVLATQRPSTDVLTGLIKANVPTRIAFQVSSGTDSRVIIDSVGAEKLLGHGDMLFVPPGAGHPQRLHGAFVGDAETDRITDFLRSSGEPNYIDGITNKQDPETLGAFGAAEAADSKEDADPLYEEAIEIVLTTGKASISSVQRQLRIGYNRAARMIEDMQEQGIVSEPVNGVRKVLGAPRNPS